MTQGQVPAPVQVGGANDPAWLRGLNGLALTTGAGGIMAFASSFGASPKESIIAAAVYGVLIAPAAKASRDALEANPTAGGGANFLVRFLARLG